MRHSIFTQRIEGHPYISKLPFTFLNIFIIRGYKFIHLVLETHLANGFSIHSLTREIRSLTTTITGELTHQEKTFSRKKNSQPDQTITTNLLMVNHPIPNHLIIINHICRNTSYNLGHVTVWMSLVQNMSRVDISIRLDCFRRYS